MQSSHKRFLGILVVVFFLNGCATIRTMPSLASYGSPKIYSGTRLNCNAIAENENRLKEFNANPPKYPLLDFPFSLLLDTIILPVTIPVATYELVFGQRM